MRYYVYVLRSLRDGKMYTGCTKDLSLRLADHARGHVRSTRSRRPLELVYHEAFSSKRAALARERYFKTPGGGLEKQRLTAAGPAGQTSHGSGS